MLIGASSEVLAECRLHNAMRLLLGPNNYQLTRTGQCTFPPNIIESRIGDVPSTEDAERGFPASHRIDHVREARYAATSMRKRLIPRAAGSEDRLQERVAQEST